MRQLLLQLVLLSSFCLHGMHMNVPDNYINTMGHALDYFDLSCVNWQLMAPSLLQREQMRLCLFIYRYDGSVLQDTPRQQLLDMAMPDYGGDVGYIEDIGIMMRNAFGNWLLNSMPLCRPGLEIFGMRCRRRI